MTVPPPTTAVADVLALRGERRWLSPHLSEFAATPLGISGPARTILMAPTTDPANHSFEALYDLIDRTVPGEVLVVAGLLTVPGAIWGQILTRAAGRSGALAAIVEGGVRDCEVLAAEHLAVWAHHRSTVGAGGMCHVVGVDVPVTIADVVIEPGDTIVVDRDGIVALPRSYANEVFTVAAAYDAAETRVLTELDAGRPLQTAYEHKRAVVRELNGE